MRRRWVVQLFPWPALRSLRMLVENPFPVEARGAIFDPWDRGYDRALWEVGQNLGIDRDRPPVANPSAPWVFPR